MWVIYNHRSSQNFIVDNHKTSSQKITMKFDFCRKKWNFITGENHHRKSLLCHGRRFFQNFIAEKDYHLIAEGNDYEKLCY